MTPPLRVAIYARVSTDEQAQGDFSSVDAQIQTCESYCAAQPEWGVPDVFKDEGYSGKDTNRPDFRRLTEAVECRQYDRIVSYKLDRITRSLYDYLNLDAVCERHGAALVSVRESFDTSTPIGRAIRAILLVFAQLERETLVQRVMDKHTALVAANRYAGGRIPYGYRMTGPGQLEPDPDTAAILTRIYEAYANGGLSCLQIARGLLSEGVPTMRNGLRWHTSTILKFLRGESYRGVQTYGANIGDWPFDTIVPPDLVAAVDARLARERRQRGPRAIRYELHGLLRCHRCGLSLTQSSIARRSDGFRRIYLYCRDHKIDAGEQCRTAHVRREEVPAIVTAILDAVRRCQAAPPAPVDPAAAAAIMQASAKRTRATNAYVSGLLAEADWRRIAAECDAIEAAPSPSPLLDYETAARIPDVWESLEMGERNGAMREWVRTVTVYEDRFEVMTNPTGWAGWPAAIVVVR
jgi:DNA invertase Pin-like site-specific DNA recombinase